MLRRTKEQVAKDLPPLTRVVKYVEATKEAKLASQAFALNQLSHNDAMVSTLLAKIPTVVEAMEEAGKSIVFTWQKQHVYAIRDAAIEAGLDVETITGDDSHAEREATVTRAAKTGRSIIATIDSTGTGVNNLQYVASTVIFHALDYVPTKMAQAEARAHRIGATDPVTAVYVVMEDTVDQHTLDAVVQKVDQWTDVMGKDSTSGIGSALHAANAASEADVLAAIREAFNE
jgi:SNF2 family DNA or RNA helicase